MANSNTTMLITKEHLDLFVSRKHNVSVKRLFTKEEIRLIALEMQSCRAQYGVRPVVADYYAEQVPFTGQLHVGGCAAIVYSRLMRGIFTKKRVKEMHNNQAQSTWPIPRKVKVFIDSCLHIPVVRVPAVVVKDELVEDKTNENERMD
jgi:hypothetical protein